MQANDRGSYPYCSSFVDPITLVIMVDAVIAPCGHSFSSESIKQWLQTNKRCPLCKKPVKEEQLTPNFALRDAISSFERKHFVPVSSWSADQVAEWLQNFPASVSVDVSLVKEHKIDGQRLTGMSESDLMGFFEIADKDKAAALHTEIATLVNKANKQECVVDVQSDDRRPLLSAHDRSTNYSLCRRIFCCCCYWCLWIEEAQESETGCCCCECSRCFICEEAQRCRGCCLYDYSPTCWFWDCCCGPSHSTYCRRTMGAIFFPLFVLLMLLFGALEVTFWLFIAVLTLVFGVVILALIYFK